MGSSHKKLLEEAKMAATRLFSDRSVSIAETRDSLRDLREHIDVMIDALESSVEDGGDKDDCSTE